MTSQQYWLILWERYFWGSVLKGNYSSRNLQTWRACIWFLWKLKLIFQCAWDAQTKSGCYRIAASVRLCKTWTVALTHKLAISLHWFFIKFIHRWRGCCNIRGVVRITATSSLFYRKPQSLSNQQKFSFCYISTTKSFNAINVCTSLCNYQQHFMLFQWFIVPIFVSLCPQASCFLHWPWKSSKVWWHLPEFLTF